MPDELRQQALALLDHAWLARFRKASYDNGHHVLSPECARQIAGYVDEFIGKVLTDHPADGDELIDEGFAKSLGWVYHDALRQWASGQNGERMRVIYWPYPRGDEWYIEVDGHLSQRIPTPNKTQLRSLLAALGVPA